MKTLQIRTSLLLFIGTLAILSSNCVKDKEDENKELLKPTVPVLKTSQVTQATTSTAVSGGIITNDGGSKITAKGVVWSTYSTPTLSDYKTEDTNETWKFTSNITELESSTTYYVRAYATNSAGTGYGNVMFFNTLEGFSFTDSRDGNVYQAVKIGNQIWMAENLKYLPELTDAYSYSNTNRCYYINKYYGTSMSEAKVTTNYNIYGVLYNWPAAATGYENNTTNNHLQGICPAGWHLPSDDEWSQLTSWLIDNGYNFYGSPLKEEAKVAKAMAGSGHWANSAEFGTAGNSEFMEYHNKSGFSALPGGFRDRTGFIGPGYRGMWWTSTGHLNRFDIQPRDAWARRIDFDKVYLFNNTYEAGTAISVRCLKYQP